MKNVGKKLFLGISMGILILISVCTILGIDTSVKLYGVSNEVELPKYQFDDLWSGRYQSDIEAYYKNNFPLRTYSVKLNNQLLYTMGADINNVIIVGKDGWLFTEEYAKCSYTEINEENKKLYAEYAYKLKLLEEKLAKADKELVYVITPSKTELYPEFLPIRYTLLMQNRDEIQNNYDYLVECLQMENIQFIDMTPILTNYDSPYLFFSKTGIHWNYYAAAICATEIMEKINYCESPQIKVQEMSAPMGTEQDVYLLSNIIKGIEDENYYSVSVDYPDIKDTDRKNVFEMGTSFSGELAAAFNEDGECIWNRYTRYQYFTNRYFYKGDSYTYEAGDFYNEELIKLIQEADIFIIENNNSYIPESHYLFVDYLLNMSDEELLGKNCVNLDKEDLYIDFSTNGNSEEYVFMGFYGMEDAGRWSMKEAKLSIPLESSEDIILDLSANRFAEDTVIQFNDTIIWQTADGTETLKEIIVPKQLILNGRTNYISVKAQADIFSPKEMGMSEDDRTLAHWWGGLSVYTTLKEEK